METSLHYDLSQKQLSFLTKERVTAEHDLQLRFRGLLNTVTGVLQYQGSLNKFFYRGQQVKGEATQPLRLGAGVAISSATNDKPFINLAAKKKIGLLDGPDTVLTAKAGLEFDPSTSKVTCVL